MLQKTVVCKKFQSVSLLLRHWLTSGAPVPFSFFFFKVFLLLILQHYNCALHCNSLLSPSSLFPALFEVWDFFFASCSPSTVKQTCCYPSLLVDPQVWLTYQLQRIFHITGSLLKSQQTIALRLVHTQKLLQQSCSGSHSSRIPAGKHVYPGIILFSFNSASWIYCSEIKQIKN